MVQMDKRIRVTKSQMVGKEDGVEIFYIEGFYPQDESDPVTLPTNGIATGSILEEIETGNIVQFSEGSNTWVSQFSIQKDEEDGVRNVLSQLSRQLVNTEKNDIPAEAVR